MFVKRAVQNLKVQIAFATFDPLQIATEGFGNKEVVDSTIIELLELDSLFYVLVANAIILGLIMLLIIFISMQFTSRSDKLAEKKADINHKLQTLFFIFSLLWILDIFIAVLVYLF